MSDKQITFDFTWVDKECRHTAYGIKTRHFTKPLSEFKQALYDVAFKENKLVFTRIYLEEVDEENRDAAAHIVTGAYQITKRIKATGEKVVLKYPEDYDEIVARRDLDTEEEIDIEVINKMEKEEILINLSLSFD